MNADPFHSLLSRAKEPLGLVHCDVHGPVKVQTISGYCYWASFIDDHTRFRAVIPIKRKSDTFAAFQQYKAWAEKKTGQKIKILRDDKGGEYMSKEFNQFCINEGIERQHTVRNRPQQNGVAERANRTMEEGIIAMLYEAGLPLSFWGEALASFIHVWNRVSTSAVTGKTPYEVFYKEKPDVSRLRVWGCVSYVHIQKDKRPHGSLGSHMEKCIFIGIQRATKDGNSIIQLPRKQSLLKGLTLMKDISLVEKRPNLLLNHPACSKIHLLLCPFPFLILILPLI
jgi:hypothetical protein